MKTALLTLALALAATLGFSQTRPTTGSGIYYKYLMEIEMETIYEDPVPSNPKELESYPFEMKEWGCFKDDGKEVETSKEGKTE